jgi:hypothetical protein
VIKDPPRPSAWGRPATKKRRWGGVALRSQRVSDEKIRRELHHVEADLVGRLRSLLPKVVAGRGTDLFINSEFDPDNYAAARWRSAEPEQLLRLAREAQALRRELELPPSGPGDLFLQACEESANVDDHHRLGPRRLAERLLKALDESRG